MQEKTVGSRMIRRVVISLLIACLLPAGLSAQIRTVSKALLDSLANPPLCEEASQRLVISQMGESPVVMNEGDGIRHIDFSVRNISNEDFSIVRVSTTCACLKAQQLPLIVRAGQTSVLRMAYNPKGHPGHFDRRMFVYADFSVKDPVAVMSVKAVVNAAGAGSSQEGKRIGPLLFKSSEINFTSGEDAVRKIVVRNVGLDRMEFGFDSRVLPQCIEVSPLSMTLERGEEKEVELRYSSSLDSKKEVGGRKLQLMVTGLGQMPSRSSIPINIE